MASVGIPADRFALPRSSAGQYRKRCLTCAAAKYDSEKPPPGPRRQVVAAVKQMGLAAAGAAMLLAPPASAEKIGEWSASGLIFKDTVIVSTVQDPKIKGVTLYVADFNRSLTAKLQKDFFSEPSQASITCAVTGPGKNLFQTKTLRIRRIFDKANNALAYIAYSTRLGSTPDGDSSGGASRYRTSLCSIALPTPEVALEE